jgi:hypothetical protein
MPLQLMQFLNVNILNIIVENQYFANITFINNLFKSTHINIFTFEPYRKMSFRNRCIVAGSNGLVNLSVPVENGRDQKRPFKDVRISYREDWQKLHWRTITSCYNKSAFFDFYRDDVEKFFLKKEMFLFDLNLAIINWLKTVLHFHAEIVIRDDAGFLTGREEVIDLRDKCLPKNFQDAEAAQSCPKYFQVFSNRIGFQPNLSIIDLLFNEGPNAYTLLADTRAFKM